MAESQLWGPCPYLNGQIEHMVFEIFAGLHNLPNAAGRDMFHVLLAQELKIHELGQSGEPDIGRLDASFEELGWLQNSAEELNEAIPSPKSSIRSSK